MNTNPQVILVDENDREIGVAEKMEAHRLGQLHRAFSVFVFNSKGELLIQKRAAGKYHSGGLWTNTCCSHPQPGEETVASARLRLQEEMGIDCDLREVHKFIYKASFENGLTEHEFDHVLVGFSDVEPVVDPEEVGDWRWVLMADLLKEVSENPAAFSHWFKICLEGESVKRLTSATV